MTATAVIGALAAGWGPLLGLDLQGGVAVVLKPTAPTDAETLDQAIDIIRSRVDAIGVAEPDITRQGQTIVVQLPGVKDAQRALDLVGQTAELRFRPVVATFNANDPQQRIVAQQALEQANATLDGTADQSTTTTTAPGETTTSTAADSATTAPGDTASTSTTAVPDSTAPGDTTSTTAVPDSTAVGDTSTSTTAGDSTTSTTVAPDSTTAVPDSTAVGDTGTSTTAGDSTSTTVEPDSTTAGDSTTSTTVAPGTTVPPTTIAPENAPSLEDIVTPPDADNADRYVLLPSLDRTNIYVLAPAELTGEVVQSATADFPTGQWEVVVQMTSQGADQFDAMAQVYFGRQVAIELDGVVYSAPTINAREFGGRAIISGNFDEAEAKDLALVLRFGALPVELEPQTVQTVSATLGADALRAGIVSGLIGLALVAIYMIAYYRLLGVVAMLSLFVSGGLLWFIIAWLGETRGLALSLSGATGIILSIGVAVDSNVVYYERIKEEVKRGRVVRSAAVGSFKDAFSTIVKADTASLIGAFLLYILTIGAVRGFALYLGLATILDMVISYLFMAPLAEYLARRYNDRPTLLGLLPPEPEEAR